MRKLFLFIGFLTITALAANAQQISENAIGIRFGDNNGFGGEISYQRKLSNTNRLEVDLGIRGNKNYSAFKATGLYEWVWQLEDRFNWYAGVGGGFGSWKTKSQTINGVTVNSSSSTSLFGAGVIGVEYSFDIPLMVSLDFRPEFGFSDAYDGFNSDFGLSVRYQF
ncbi:outer membrane insertion C-terminal signal [Tenacibaculum sp. MAR_2010_89]|uniref:outer membrane beta-barrel protein n=1 Tax=Tenacibaculum sp. MAR_2010_89 TaxID=1250198 RepID=UPI0008960081|nr:outer membrane beta-barrel protein [Tenacibaculum sp. MAR_2010_89]SED59371.1 outer membrane insertion C-terminal signal [Tenacibaculum sp. MAR_2010_89]